MDIAVHQQEIQTLLEASEEFFILTQGKPPSINAAHAFFTDLPFNKSLDDKLCLGVFQQKELVGIIDLIKSYPKPDVWFLGLLLIHPTFRYKHLGKDIMFELEQALIKEDVQTLRLAIIQENDSGYQFWQKIGYTLKKKQPYKVADKDTEVYVMSKRL